MSETIPVTQETYDRLRAERDEIKRVKRPAILVDLDAARANGDLKENADYHAAKEKLQELDNRIMYLEDRISRSQILEHDTAAAEHITFGATVLARNMANGRQVEYMLVSSDAVDPAQGKISSTSPIGKALIGRKRGDTISVQTPRGINQFEVIDYH